LARIENLSDQSPSSIKIFLSFFRLGLTAFGGPAMIAYIKELAVKKNKWLDEERFKDGVVFCQSIPGATAIQMAAYIGFGLPAFIFMLLFSTLYAGYHRLGFVQSLFAGLQVIVVAIIAQATYSFGRSIANSYQNIIIAVLSAASLGLGSSPFLVIPGAGLAGIILLRNIKSPPLATDRKVEQWKIIPIIALLLILFTGLAVLYFFNFEAFILSTLMMKIYLFAFGGGFTSLPLMLHEVVGIRGWMDSKTFMDDIALGQVTPGPIVITAAFVGYLLQGFGGSLVAMISIFTPSFFNIDHYRSLL